VIIDCFGWWMGTFFDEEDFFPSFIISQQLRRLQEKAVPRFPPAPVGVFVTPVAHRTDMVRGTPTRGSRAADAVGETAEVVFLGEITGGTGFHHTCRGSVLCKYVVVHGEHWHLDKGAVSGATQAASSSPCGGEFAPWGHPFQLAFNTTSVQVRDGAEGTDLLREETASAENAHFSTEKSVDTEHFSIR
jgi:hypothetical protein